MNDGAGTLGRYLIGLGLVIIVIGVVLVLAGKFPGLRIGRLPGDFYVERGNWTFYFPLATSILLSIVLSLVLWFFNRKS
jgi:tellurite resistance protein TehA-like permease